MADISFTSSFGDAILAGGNSYQLKGTGLGTPTDTASVIQYSSISGYTYTNSDPQGKTVYTAGEVAQSLYEFGLRNTSTAVSSPMQCTYNQTYKAVSLQNSDPSGGETDWLRYGRWINATTGKCWYNTSSNGSSASWTWINTKGTLVPIEYGVVRVWKALQVASYKNGTLLNWSTAYTYQNSLAYNLVPGEYIQGRGTTTASNKAFGFSFLASNYP